MSSINVQVRGIRQTVPPGYIMGRQKGVGAGPPQLLSLQNLDQLGLATKSHVQQVVASSSGGGGGGLLPINSPSTATFTKTIGSPVSQTALAGQGLLLDAGAFVNSDNLNGYAQNYPATPCTVTLGISFMEQPGNFNLNGLMISDGTKIISFSYGPLDNTSTPGTSGSLKIDYWTNSTTFSSEPYRFYCQKPGLLRVYDDGTNLNFLTSQDGAAWTCVAQLGRTAFLTPSYVGYFMSPHGTSNDSVHGYALIYFWYVNTASPTATDHSVGGNTETQAGALGTVTSVGFSAPSIFTVTNQPVVGSGTITLTLASEAQNSVLAGPSSGGAGTPTFRALVAGDIPSTLNSTVVSAATAPYVEITDGTHNCYLGSATGATNFFTDAVAGDFNVRGGGTTLRLGVGGGASTVQITSSGASVNSQAILTDQGAWSTFTPSVACQTGTITSATTSGRYLQRGKVVHCQVSVAITNAGTGSGYLLFSLPVTAQNLNWVGAGYESSVTGYTTRVTGGTTTQGVFFFYNGSSAVTVTGYTLFAAFTYEAA